VTHASEAPGGPATRGTARRWRALTGRRSDKLRGCRALTGRRSDKLRGCRALTGRRSDKLRGGAEQRHLLRSTAMPMVTLYNSASASRDAATLDSLRKPCPSPGKTRYRCHSPRAATASTMRWA
jgi:hypothetical protein